jgi:hypothetical protein
MTRRFKIAQEERRLRQSGFPRLQMFLIVVLTGGVGLLTSAGMLHAGFEVMWSRYLCAMLAAYGAFFVFVWLWLRIDSRTFDSIDFDLGQLIPSSISSTSTSISGGGGDAAGGGAGGLFDSADAVDVNVSSALESISDSPVGDAFGVAVEAEELAIPFYLAFFALAVSCAALFVVYSAPALFAELTVDALLMRRFYKNMPELDNPSHWIATVFRQTWWAFLLTGLSVVTIAFVLGKIAPQAHTLAQVLHQI